MEQTLALGAVKELPDPNGRKRIPLRFRQYGFDVPYVKFLGAGYLPLGNGPDFENCAKRDKNLGRLGKRKWAYLEILAEPDEENPLTSLRNRILGRVENLVMDIVSCIPQRFQYL